MSTTMRVFQQQTFFLGTSNQIIYKITHYGTGRQKPAAGVLHRQGQPGDCNQSTLEQGFGRERLLCQSNFGRHG